MLFLLLLLLLFLGVENPPKISAQKVFALTPVTQLNKYEEEDEKYSQWEVIYSLLGDALCLYSSSLTSGWGR